MLCLQVEKASIAHIKELLLIPKQALGHRPFPVERRQVFRIVSHVRQPDQHGRRHEQRVAPPPHGFGRGILKRCQAIHNRLGRAKPRRVRMLGVQSQVSLPQGFIVRVWGKARIFELPVPPFGRTQNRIMPLRMVRRRRGRKQPIVESRIRPEPIELRLTGRKLPVHNLHHGSVHGGFRQSRRKLGKRAGILR